MPKRDCVRGSFRRGRGRPRSSRSGDRRYKFVPGDLVPVGAEVIERAARPGHGEAQALFGAGAIGGILRALVESHADVRAEGDLHVDGMLGSKEVRTPIEVRAEAHAVVGDFAQLAERENLKAAGVGEQGARPTDEFVQAAHAADGLVAGAQVEVIGVAENDLGAERFQRVLRDGFDRSLRADGHEDRGFDGLMRKTETSAASAGVQFRPGAGKVESLIDSSGRSYQSRGRIRSLRLRSGQRHRAGTRASPPRFFRSGDGGDRARFR